MRDVLRCRQKRSGEEVVKISIEWRVLLERLSIFLHESPRLFPSLLRCIVWFCCTLLYGKIWGQREKNRHKSDKKNWCVLETAFSTLQNIRTIFQFTFVLFVNPRDYVRGCFFLNFPSVSFFKAADPLCSSSSLVNVYTSVPRYPPFIPICH